MYAEERRQVIGELARAEGRVQVASLAARFGVTTETVRRDLSDLELRGILRRVHGGAIAAERLGYEPAVTERASVATGEKRRIATAALAHVPRRGSILLDAGTTTSALAAVLPSDRELTVVTNAVPLALNLPASAGTSVMLIGGRVRARTLAAVDGWALRTLAELTVDVAFIATNGVSAERGLTTPDPAEAAVKRAMVRAGRRVVLLADHTKIGDHHFERFADVADVDVLITDTSADADELDRLRAAGTEVVQA